MKKLILITVLLIHYSCGIDHRVDLSGEASVKAEIPPVKVEIGLDKDTKAILSVFLKDLAIPKLVKKLQQECEEIWADTENNQEEVKTCVQDDIQRIIDMFMGGE